MKGNTFKQKANLNSDYDDTTNFTGKKFMSEAGLEEKKFFDESAEKLI